MIYIGDDWAEEHHDVHIMDDSGHRLAAPPEVVAAYAASTIAAVGPTRPQQAVV